MYFYNSDKDNPTTSSEQVFDDLMNDWDDNTFFGGLSHSLPSNSFHFETTPSPNLQQQQQQQQQQLKEEEQWNYALDPSVLLDSNNIDFILSSDPAFIRQQQLLQEQSKPHSNLSAMLDNKPLIQPINLITSQQQRQNILDKMLSSSSADNIPIASQQPTVDHQRRFNELQARFRVNYVKKTKKATSSLGSSMPNTLNDIKSSPKLTDKRRSSFDPPSSATTGSKPILKLNGATRMKTTTNKQQVIGLSIPSSKPTSTNDNVSFSFPSRTMPIQIQRQQRPNSLQSLDIQKKLDDQLVKVDFDDITVSELKEMLRQRGKPATGKKAILLQRLLEERDSIVHARTNPIPRSPHASSLPDFCSSPTSGAIGSLNKEIANMHIGSPPVQRRFSPYGTSPRSTTNIAPAPTVTKGFNLKKSYIPITPSTLATPDHEKNVNPFDLVKQETNNEQPEENDYQQYIVQDNNTNNNNVTFQDMDWTDPNMDFIFKQDSNLYEFEDRSTEELISYLLNQGTDTSFND